MRQMPKHWRSVMTKPSRGRGKRLVVDASIAERTRRCRAVLTLIEERHQAAFSDEGLVEWRRHEGDERSFARSWRMRMVAAKRLVRLGDVRDEQLREALREAASIPTAQRDMEKDAHLIEAARSADSIVLSCDEKARGHFRAACAKVEQLRPIHWGNPETEQAEILPWLEKGARNAPAGGSAPPPRVESGRHPPGAAPSVLRRFCARPHSLASSAWNRGWVRMVARSASS